MQDYGDDDPNLGGGSGPVANPGNTGSWQTLLQYQLNVVKSCRIVVLGSYKLSYNQAGAAWATQLLIDGVVVDDSWGGAPLDKVSLLGASNVAAGNHEIKMLWQASSSNLQVYRPRMSVSWSYR